MIQLIIGLIYFVSRDSDDIKVQMVTALYEIGADYPGRRIKLPENRLLSTVELYVTL